MKINALLVDVHRFPLGDCTNHGISSIFKFLLIACPDGPKSFDPDVEIPLNFCMVERRKLNFAPYEYVDIVPATVNEHGQIVRRPGWWMNGGNIADCSDSRFRNISCYPLRIHDRRE